MQAWSRPLVAAATLVVAAVQVARARRRARHRREAAEDAAAAAGWGGAALFRPPDAAVQASLGVLPESGATLRYSPPPLFPPSCHIMQLRITSSEPKALTEFSTQLHERNAWGRAGSRRLPLCPHTRVFSRSTMQVHMHIACTIRAIYDMYHTRAIYLVPNPNHPAFLLSHCSYHQ